MASWRSAKQFLPSLCSDCELWDPQKLTIRPAIGARIFLNLKKERRVRTLSADSEMKANIEHYYEEKSKKIFFQITIKNKNIKLYFSIFKHHELISHPSYNFSDPEGKFSFTGYSIGAILLLNLFYLQFIYLPGIFNFQDSMFDSSYFFHIGSMDFQIPRYV